MSLGINFGILSAASNNIVTSGLILHLDAGNTNSYPGSGTTWTDLSGNGNNGTLINGPTFNSGNGGSIVFDGVNDYVSFSTITNISYTIDFWYKMGGNDGSYGYFASSGDNGLAISEGGTAVGLSYGEFYYYNGSAATRLGSSIPSLTEWNNITSIIDTSSNIIKVYGNGSLISNNSISNLSTSVTNIGRYITTNLNFLKGNLASYKVYNRALTASEVLQNYNATKGRYL